MIDGPNGLVLELARIALKGDGTAARLFLKQVLRRAPQSGGTDAQLRAELAELLVKNENAMRAVKGAPKTLREVSPANEGSVASLVMIDDSPLEPLVLELGVETAIQDVLLERKNKAALAAVGLEPVRSLLFVGPPGVGKTMTARKLAHDLDLPLLRLDLANVVSSWLGRTGQNLRQVLDHARRTACVCLLDEFDSLGKRRDDPSDMGELKRIVNVLLLELENWQSESLLIAATNHPDLLDPAIWRRFERVVRFELPSIESRRELLELGAARYRGIFSEQELDAIAKATDGWSAAELSTLAREAARAVALSGKETMGATLARLVLRRLASEARADPAVRHRYCQIAAVFFGMSQREIASELGVSHVTVGKVLRSEASLG